MVLPTQPMREEHRELMSQTEMLLWVADSVGTNPAQLLLQEVNKVYDFLVGQLIPHATAEDRVLYPLVGQTLGTPLATATMSRDHVELKRLIEQLTLLRDQLATEPLNAYRQNELRRLLYGMYALLRVHFAKEEEVYLRLLDEKYTAEQMEQVYKQMETAAQDAMDQPKAILLATT